MIKFCELFKTNRKKMITSLVIVFTAFFIAIGSNFFLKQDNVIEETCEAVIEKVTGMEDLDLSPDTIEEDDEDFLLEISEAVEKWDT